MTGPNLIALETATNDVEARIGDQFFYVISSSGNSTPVTAPVVELSQLLDRCGLSAFKPTPVKAHDAFRSATKELETRLKITWNQKQAAAQLYVRELRSDKDAIIRAVVREVIDHEDAEIYYDTVAHLIFRRAYNSFAAVLTPGFSAEFHYAQLIEQARQKYNDLVGQVNEARIRIMLGEMLGRLHPTTLKRGVYFIPNVKSHIDGLDRIQEFVEGLNSILRGGSIRSQRLYIYDRDKMEIEKNMREQTIAHIESLKAQLREIRNDPSTLTERTERVATILKQASEARRKIEIYEMALDLTMANLRKRVESLREEAYAQLR